MTNINLRNIFFRSDVAGLAPRKNRKVRLFCGGHPSLEKLEAGGHVESKHVFLLKIEHTCHIQKPRSVPSNICFSVP